MPRLFSVKVILYFCFLLLLDWVFTAPLRRGSFQPVFLYLIALYAGFEGDWRQTFRFAFAAGFLRDALSTQPMGVETAVLLAAALSLSFFVKKVERRSVVMRMIIGFIFIFGVNLFVLAISNLLGFSQQSLGQCLALAGSTAGSTVLFLPLFFFLTAWWFTEKEALRQYELFR